MSLKWVTLVHPLFSKENGGLKSVISKPPSGYLFLCLGAQIPAANATVFLLSRWADDRFRVETVQSHSHLKNFNAIPEQTNVTEF